LRQNVLRDRTSSGIKHPQGQKSPSVIFIRVLYVVIFYFKAENLSKIEENPPNKEFASVAEKLPE
jgi:hypothetical protein